MDQTEKGQSDITSDLWFCQVLPKYLVIVVEQRMQLQFAVACWPVGSSSFFETAVNNMWCVEPTKDRLLPN